MAEAWKVGVDGLVDALGTLVDAADAGYFGATAADRRDLFGAVREQATGFREWLVVSAPDASVAAVRTELNTNTKVLRGMRDAVAEGGEGDVNSIRVVGAIDQCVSLANGVRQSLGVGAAVTLSVSIPMPPVPAPVSRAPRSPLAGAEMGAGAETPLAPFTMVSVLFATDREGMSDAKTGVGFTAKRSGTGELTYGEAAVSIPAKHERESWSRRRFCGWSFVRTRRGISCCKA